VFDFGHNEEAKKTEAEMAFKTKSLFNKDLEEEIDRRFTRSITPPRLQGISNQATVEILPKVKSPAMSIKFDDEMPKSVRIESTSVLESETKEQEKGTEVSDVDSNAAMDFFASKLPNLVDRNEALERSGQVAKPVNLLKISRMRSSSRMSSGL
jgi:hypothetical protein